MTSALKLIAHADTSASSLGHHGRSQTAFDQRMNQRALFEQQYDAAREQTPRSESKTASMEAGRRRKEQATDGREDAADVTSTHKLRDSDPAAKGEATDHVDDSSVNQAQDQQAKQHDDTQQAAGKDQQDVDAQGYLGGLIGLGLPTIQQQVAAAVEADAMQVSDLEGQVLLMPNGGESSSTGNGQSGLGQSMLAAGLDAANVLSANQASQQSNAFQQALMQVNAGEQNVASHTAVVQSTSSGAATLPDGMRAVLDLQNADESGNTSRIARGLKNALQQQNGSLTLRLTPASMGTVRIELQVDRGMVQASLTAETDSAHRLLSQQLNQLKASLEGQGLNVDKLHVQTMNSSNASSNPQNQEDQMQDERRQSQQDQRPSQDNGRRRDEQGRSFNDWTAQIDDNQSYVSAQADQSQHSEPVNELGDRT